MRYHNNIFWNNHSRDATTRHPCTNKRNIMKTNIIIFIFATLTFFACGGGTTQNAGTDGANADSASRDGVPTVSTTTNDTIVKTIWEKLKTDDPHISKVVAEGNAVDFNYYKDDEEHYFSKTSMDYKYHVPKGSEEPDNYINAIYRLQCYPMSDGGWLATVEQSVNGYQLQEEDCGYKLFVVKYNDGKISYPQYTDYFPECLSYVEERLGTDSDRDRSKLKYSDAGISYKSSTCWPLKFVWNGKKFETPSKFIYEAINMWYGDLNTPFGSATVGSKWYGSPDGILKDKSGNKIAEIELNGEIVEGYTVFDPSCGAVQDNNSDSITHSPIAIGYPIKNVLEYKDNPKAWTKNMKDTTITKGMKDGKYVITQQLCHDKINKKRDVFIDFVAEDENSPIETIRVYSKPFEVSIQGEVELAEGVSAEAKEIFKALDANEYDNGKFKHVSTDYNIHNGFSLYFNDDTNLCFHIYKTNDGRYLVMLVKFDVLSKKIGEKFWYYKDGTLTPTDFKIPDTQLKEKYIYMRFGDDFIQYDNGEYKPMDRIEEHYLWNGEEFESEIGLG